MTTEILGTRLVAFIFAAIVTAAGLSPYDFVRLAGELAALTA